MSDYAQARIEFERAAKTLAERVKEEHFYPEQQDAILLLKNLKKAVATLKERQFPKKSEGEDDFFHGTG